MMGGERESGKMGAIKCSLRALLDSCSTSLAMDDDGGACGGG